MPTNLVVVESPYKASRIQAMLTKALPTTTWVVLPTFGHFVDLPKKKLGIDATNNYKLKWDVIKRSVVKELQVAAKRVDEAFICTDLDREGEGIAQHVYNLLVKHLPDEAIYRATFNEVTRHAIVHAIQNPGKIDQDLVAAQQARRACDRLIGYLLSPVLWKQVGSGTSAGRVQTCVLNELVERTRARRNFVARDQWYVHANLVGGGIATSERFDTASEAQTVYDALGQASIKITLSESAEEHPPPSIFRTSKLLKVVHQRYKFSSGYTMQLAQRLFELGLITYHRTTSSSINIAAANAANKVVSDLCGDAYCADQPRLWDHTAGAHEGIRACDPHTYPSRTNVNSDQRKVYELVWALTLASQSVPAKLTKQLAEYRTSSLKSAPAMLTCRGQYYTFDGWHKPSGSLFKKYESKLDIEDLDIKDLKVVQTQTEPPNRYTEASLIAWMERVNVGRPSTYASIIRHILNWFYVSNSGRGIDSQLRGELITTYLGLVDDKLLDPAFTAELEKVLDDVKTGQQTYQSAVDLYYKYLDPLLTKAKQLYLTTKEQCSKCSQDYEVWLDKTDDPYLYCPKCKGWVWAIFDASNQIVAKPKS